MHATTGTGAFDIELGGRPIMGALDAPVSIYYWSEYQCPFCERFESDTLPKLIENHVSTGDVRMVFIEFPYIGKSSMTAAVMDQCVWRQVKGSNPDAYWRWHSAVFEAQGKENSGWASQANLLDITRDVEGVSTDDVEQCMSQNRNSIEKNIEADSQRARSLGISGTPGFIVYNRQSEEGGKIVGAQPYDQFESAIEQVNNS
ncbi:DsbA family protein [Halococcus qingdaonensis]|uniref:DsbA family protein n=1 Tax=Halococcus qingdaonensis TaxID=224402 RepID=UPI00211632C2|nr:thioredoxin domain-containing protein [Halococcus qingdaonensis]